MRCPSCSKFAANDTSSEPEIDLNEVEFTPDEGEKTGTLQISGSVRIVLTAECCGDELKEASFDFDESEEITREDECECTDFDASVESSEITDRSETHNAKGKPIPYRYQRRYYGYSASIEVSCSCGKTKTTIEVSDDIQASGMDELV